MLTLERKEYTCRCGLRGLHCFCGRKTVCLDSMLLQELYLIREKTFFQGYCHRPSI